MWRSCNCCLTQTDMQRCTVGEGVIGWSYLLEHTVFLSFLSDCWLQRKSSRSRPSCFCLQTGHKTVLRNKCKRTINSRIVSVYKVLIIIYCRCMKYCVYSTMEILGGSFCETWFERIARQIKLITDNRSSEKYISLNCHGVTCVTHLPEHPPKDQGRL